MTVGAPGEKRGRGRYQIDNIIDILSRNQDQYIKLICINVLEYQYIQGVFFNWYPPKKLKYGKPRLGESTAS